MTDEDYEGLNPFQQRMVDAREGSRSTHSPRLGEIALAQKNIRDQEGWIRDHGATLEGYIARYGGEDARAGTLGGLAIYAADILYLHLLAGQLRDAVRRARRWIYEGRDDRTPRRD